MVEHRQELQELHSRARQTAQELEAHATKVLDMAQRIEALTGGTQEWYRGMRAKVEAAATVRQARALVRALKELHKAPEYPM